MHTCAYNLPVKVEWNYLKATSNLKKHNVDFADAVTVLDDDLAITMRDESYGEERFVTLGTDAVGRLLVVVYTWREDCLRIISARMATPRERRRYES